MKNTVNEKIIFTFWEPKDHLPAYLKLCMATWKKYLPEYEIKLLDYSSLNEYLPEGFFDKSLYTDYSLPKQADAIRCALLEKYGGIWFDCDTIITSDKFRQFLEIDSEFITLGFHIGFIIAKAHSKISKKWLSGIQRNIFFHKYFSRYCVLRNLARITNKSYIKRLDRWDFMGNSILDKYFKKYPSNLYYSIDKLEHNAFPEIKAYPNMSATEAYQTFYFKDELKEYNLKDSSGIINLHNSWTPENFRNMPVEEFLEQKVTLAELLKTLLSMEEIEAAVR